MSTDQSPISSNRNNNSCLLEERAATDRPTFAVDTFRIVHKTGGHVPKATLLAWRRRSARNWRRSSVGSMKPLCRVIQPTDFRHSSLMRFAATKQSATKLPLPVTWTYKVRMAHTHPLKCIIFSVISNLSFQHGTVQPTLCWCAGGKLLTQLFRLVCEKLTGQTMRLINSAASTSPEQLPAEWQQICSVALY